MAFASKTNKTKTAGASTRSGARKIMRDNVVAREVAALMAKEYKSYLVGDTKAGIEILIKVSIDRYIKLAEQLKTALAETLSGEFLYQEIIKKALEIIETDEDDDNEDDEFFS